MMRKAPVRTPLIFVDPKARLIMSFPKDASRSCQSSVVVAKNMIDVTAVKTMRGSREADVHEKSATRALANA